MFLLDMHNISLAMQEGVLGESLTEVASWQKMMLKMPNLSQPQPSLLEYFGTAEEDLGQYCSTFQGFHMEVDDPIQEETDEVALMVVGRDAKHGRTKILSGVTKPKKTLTQIKATLTADNPLSRLLDGLFAM